MKEIVNQMIESFVQEGREAYLSGEYLEPESCPYERGTIERELWVQGWTQEYEKN